MAQLLSQCHEVLNGIFQGVDPEDLASLSKTCRLFNGFIKNDRLLWKDMYLRNYDHLFLEPGQPEPEWRAELQKLVFLKKLLQSDDSEIKRKHLSEVATTMIKLLGTASADYEKSLNMTFLTEAFKNQVNLDTLLCSSSLFEHAGSKSSHPAPTPSEQQLSAKMHVFYGRSVEPLLDADDENARARRVHPYARSRVYDLRRYNDYNEWGPFLDDGTCSIDWEKVQCIMTVLLYNLRALNERSTYHQRGSRQWPERRNNPFDGTAPYSFVPIPTPCPAHEAAKVKEPVPDLAAEDPYGVTGTWRRIVCFLDYTDLYAFNFEGARLPLPEERPPIDTQEAIRIITLKIRVTAVSPPGEDDHPDWPVVSFNGTSRSMHTSWDPNANSKIRGTVRTTKEGEVRWTSFSIYHGEERWRSEGVQIGGLRSGRGIIGTWFDKDYDVHGPAGPTAFWKTSDDVEVENAEPAQSFIWVH